MALVDILCSDPGHNGRRGQPGHTDVLGKHESGTRTPMVCDACARALRVLAAQADTVREQELNDLATALGVPRSEVDALGLGPVQIRALGRISGRLPVEARAVTPSVTRRTR